MKFYMSLTNGEHCKKYLWQYPTEDIYLLVAYPYRNALDGHSPSSFKDFIADSGAFTAMTCGIKIDDEYTRSYADWVVSNGIRKYVELDLDEVIGVEPTEQLRARLEDLVGYPSIPCWHIERGKEGWQRMCDEYDYVAISLSGFTKTSKWLAAHKYEPLKWFMREARKRGAKVHALGCSNLSLIERFRFDSSDSSTYTVGVRYGTVLQFNNGRMRTVRQNRRYKKDYDKIAQNNVAQTVRMMRYAEKYL